MIIDDATRFVVHAEFYDNQRLPILEDGLRKAILRCGLPSAIYVDNGKIFVSGWHRLACAKLGIRHMRTQPYSPEAKGKVERFNRTVEEFFEEVKLYKLQKTYYKEQYANKDYEPTITTPREFKSIVLC